MLAPAGHAAPTTNAPAHIVVLLASDAPPYQEALHGLQSFFSQSTTATQISSIFLPKDTNANSDLPLDMSQADVIVAFGSAALAHLKQQRVGKPVIAGMVLSIDELRNTNNMSGVTLELPLSTEVEWLQRFVPAKPRIGLLYSEERNANRYGKSIQGLSDTNHSLVIEQVTSPQQLPLKLKNIESNIDVLWGIPDQVIYTPQTAKDLLLFSFRHRIPLIGLSRAWVKGGALYALDRDYVDIGKQCAELTQQVLQGMPVNKIAPVYPRNVRYSINLKTAKHMKIDIDSGLIKGASEVFE